MNEPHQNDLGDWVCQHGTAVDVHCCNCHSGFLFDIDSCTCLEPPMLTTDDYYALLRIIEILPVCDPFLTNLQTRLSADERARHGDHASHLSGPDFAREIDRVEGLIAAALHPHVAVKATS